MYNFEIIINYVFETIVNLFPYFHNYVIYCTCECITNLTWRQMLRYNAKQYRHSFCIPEKMIFIITNLNTLYIILVSPEFWTCVYKIRQYLANYRLRFVAETYALTSKCHVLCYAKHHSPVVKRRHFRCAWAKFLAIFDNLSINCIRCQNVRPFKHL